MLVSRNRLRPLALASVALALTLSGCRGQSDDTPAVPDDLISILTTALAQHTLEGVPLTDDAAATLFDRQVGDLAQAPVTVTAADVDTTGESGTVALDWTWTLHQQEWTYRTMADLARTGSQWQVNWKPTALARDLSATEVLRAERTFAPRADILGAGGRTIVTERPVWRYGLNKQVLGTLPLETSARAIAKALGVDEESFLKRARAAGPKQFVEALVIRVDDVPDKLGDTFDRIPGARIVKDTLPLAPTADFAAEILGRVGPATAELVTKSEGRIEAGDTVGLSGLQARYDEQLAGTPTVTVSAVPEPPAAATAAATESAAPSEPVAPVDPAEAGEPRVLKSWPGVAPKPLTLTLDARTQQSAEAALAPLAGAKHGASALVAIRPSTGAVLAAANGPDNNGTNAATFGQYAPGSTFKVVSSLALLRAGMKPGDTLACPATTVVNGKTFKNYDDYPASGLGQITFATALANSCNTAMVNARSMLGPDDLTRAAADLGLGVDHDLGFPAYFGQVPPPAGETEKAADMIGQGKVLASPMAMAAVAASVQSGTTVVPRLVAQAPAPKAPTSSLTVAEARQLRTLMKGVVTRGSGRFLARFGPGVGAKTGTAEFGTARAGGKLATHTWMIAFKGDLAVAVMVEKGDSGSATAGPVLTRFFGG